MNESKQQGRSTKAKVVCSSPEEYAFIAKVGGSSDSWVIDFGATSHMAANKEFFESLNATITETITDDGIKTKCADKGVYCLQCAGPDGSANIMILNNTLFVPDLETKMFSVRSATKSGATIVFVEAGCRISKGAKVVAVGNLERSPED